MAPGGGRKCWAWCSFKGSKRFHPYHTHCSIVSTKNAGNDKLLVPSNLPFSNSAIYLMIRLDFRVQVNKYLSSIKKKLGRMLIPTNQTVYVTILKGNESNNHPTYHQEASQLASFSFFLVYVLTFLENSLTNASSANVRGVSSTNGSLS
jgi:hypothetical protein